MSCLAEKRNVEGLQSFRLIFLGAANGFEIRRENGKDNVSFYTSRIRYFSSLGMLQQRLNFQLPERLSAALELF